MNIHPGKTCIGFVGLGVMGRSMAGHLLAAGYELHLFTRSRESADDLISQGAHWEDNLKSLAQKSSVVISMVGYPNDVEEIYLGAEGILAHAASGSLVIDMTTSKPGLARAIHAQAAKAGILSLDAPVSGGDIGARNATLSIMVGGDKAGFDMALPVLKLMGTNVVYQGKAGSGQHTKMANQIAIAAGMVGVCESLAYAKKAGLDPETVLESIGQGAAGSWSLNNLGPRMIKGDFAPGFYVKHFIKDMGIAAEASGGMDQETPGLELALKLYRKLAEKGHKNLGTQSLFKLFD